MCSDLNVINITEYESSEFSDLPTWRTMRNIACEYASDEDLIVWVNSDIVFDESIVETVIQLRNSGENNFILTGRRKNWPNFFKLNKKEDLLNIEYNKIGNEWEIDYFVYQKKHFKDLQKFFIARMRFDNYLVKFSIDSVDKTMDSTFAINAYHHEHAYGQNLDQDYYSATTIDSTYIHDRNINSVLSPIANIDDIKYKIKLENKKITFI
jgi:hypothetical protein